MKIPRRNFITLLGGAAAAWPLVTRAQQADHMRRIGVLSSAAQSDADGRARVTAFREALDKLGWVDGRNVRIDYRFAAANPDRMRAYAKELVALVPDAILTTSEPVLLALHQATNSIPIIFLGVGDPVRSGYVMSLARPGGNITGFTQFEYAMGGKWLEVLKEIAPSVLRVAVIADPGVPSATGFLRAITVVAPSLAVKLTTAYVRNAVEIDRAIDEIGREPNGGLVVLPGPVTSVHRDLIAASAARHRLPAIGPFRFYPESGCLVSYGLDFTAEYRRAASYVDRILRGEKPADLPVQAPTKFELVINLKTAKAIGLTIPESFLLRADEVIE